MAVALTVKFQQDELATSLAGQPLEVNKPVAEWYCVVDWQAGRLGNAWRGGGDADGRRIRVAGRDATAAL